VVENKGQQASFSGIDLVASSGQGQIHRALKPFCISTLIINVMRTEDLSKSNFDLGG
jgi:hypothetical protein